VVLVLALPLDWWLLCCPSAWLAHDKKDFILALPASLVCAFEGLNHSANFSRLLNRQDMGAADDLRLLKGNNNKCSENSE